MHEVQYFWAGSNTEGVAQTCRKDIVPAPINLGHNGDLCMGPHEGSVSKIKSLFFLSFLEHHLGMQLI